MKVLQIMNEDVITCEKDAKVKDIAKIMIENNITGVPVVDGKKVIGIITEADIIMQKSTLHIPDYIQLLNSFLYLEDPKEFEDDLKKILATKASELMTTEVVTVASQEDVSNLACLIEEEHINPVPVVDDGKLVGIVSRADIVKLLARE